MSILLNEIFKWAEASLLYWEQVALDKIIAHQTLTEADCKECLSYLLQDKDLESLSSVSRPKISFLQNISTDMVQEKAKKRLYLQSIYNLENVNALVSNQNITFSKGLTVIYGTNGSGKSGYARVLGRAGFTRGDQEILRDILQPVDADNPPSAKIELGCVDVW